MFVAKIFNNGMSQAVRLPKEFRFDTKEVFIKKEKDKVILIPKKDDALTWEDFFYNTPKFEDFQISRVDNDVPQKRECI